MSLNTYVLIVDYPSFMQKFGLLIQVLWLRASIDILNNKNIEEAQQQLKNDLQEVLQTVSFLLDLSSNRTAVDDKLPRIWRARASDDSITVKKSSRSEQIGKCDGIVFLPPIKVTV